MDTNRGTGDRGRSSAVARMLEHLWRYEHPFFLYCFAVVSFALFHGHEYVIPVDSDAICSSEIFIARASLVIPKLKADCELIATTLLTHPHKEAAIVLDLWIFFAFLFSTIAGIFSAGMNIKPYMNMMRGFHLISYWRKIYMLVFGITCIAGSIWIALFESLLVSEPYTIASTMSTLAFYGFGASFQTLIVGASYAFYGIVHFSIFSRKPSIQVDTNER